MYFDEEQILELRLNVLDEKVDFFVIVESIYNHRGDKRDLLFNKNKFLKFSKKIIYLVSEEIPKNVEPINENEDKKEKDRKYIMNAIYRENAQRNLISKGIKNANKDDLIMISDVDEIPKLESLDLKSIKNEIFIFKQHMFHYKYNLVLPNFKWTGTKAIKKKNLISPQWLRNIKDKKYPYYRIDIIFSKKKYTNLKIIDDGGWHFTNIKTPKMIRHKFKSYLHHFEFDQTNLVESDIENFIKKKQAIYNLKVDKRGNKVGNGETLDNFDIKKLPIYIQYNLEKYKDWID
jgi:beta-1,4-mannosyl-glycoprotein beta-1,4-N-acetylglucosaminyltransferase|tara:strand:+ start:226 stop:1095 length:870 start_codon:yes stop_codon:yes gene_type:complete